MIQLSALDRKLFRDLWHIRGQAVAIALVLASGIAMFVMSRGTLESLQTTQHRYYEQSRFAHVFAHLKRAPESLASRIAAIPGVQQVQSRIVADVSLNVPNLPEPAIGRLISIPDTHLPPINQLYLRRGRYIDPLSSGEVLISEGFAEAHEIGPGDRISAVINGHWESLNIVGIVLSPEYILQMKPGDTLPDDKRFGVFWMLRRDLEAAYDMTGAFNDVVLTLHRGASEAEVLRQMDQLIDPYGGIGAYGRDDQLSHRFLSDEIAQLRGMGFIAPMIFLGVAAFLIQVVTSRLVRTQREQIALLKAFGYTRWQIGSHFLKLILIMCCFGVLLGVPIGANMGSGMTKMYIMFYRFPIFEFLLPGYVIVLAIFIGVAAAVIGAWGAVRAAMALPPAEAMRPEAPAVYRPTIIEKLGLRKLVSISGRMILRKLEREPFKAISSCIGIAMATAILLLGNFGLDAFEYIVNVQFYEAQRQDVMVSLFEPTSAEVSHELSQLPGVTQAQMFRSVPMEISFGHRHRRLTLMGVEPEPELMRHLDRDREPVQVPPQGLLVSRALANILHVQPGDVVTVEILEGDRLTHQLPIVNTVDDFSGLNAYMSLAALHRLLREGDTVSGAFLSVQRHREQELFDTLKQTPRIASSNAKHAMIENFNATIAENQLQMQSFNLMFAAIIAFGVIYNTARVSLTERARELSTMRILGFTRGEVSIILLGELAVLTLLAIPLGLAIGFGLAAMISLSMDTEVYRIPLVMNPPTYAFAAAATIIFSIVSGIMVRRRINRLDLIRVLKQPSDAMLKSLLRPQRLFMFAVIFAVVAAMVWASMPQPIVVETRQVQRGRFELVIEEDGKTRVKERYIVSAPLAGRILRVQWEVGDAVVENETDLVTLVPADASLLDERSVAEIEARVRAADATVLRARALAASEDAERERAQIDLDRVTKLFNSNASTDRELEDAKLALRARQSNTEAAQAAIRMAEYEAELARSALDYRKQLEAAGGNPSEPFVLKAPISGSVLHVYHESSRIVPAGEPLLVVGDANDVEIVVDVLSTDAVRISPGDAVRIERWGGEFPLDGVVRTIEPAAFTKISSLGVEEQRVNVIIDLRTPAAERRSLGDGYRIEAVIIIDASDDILTVPSSAVFKHEGEWSVYTIAEGAAKIAPIQIGRANANDTEVRGGLTEGQTVIRHPDDRLGEGVLVTANAEE